MAESRDVELHLGDEVATLRLLDGERSLDDLLAGEYVLRMWLTPVEPGVYRLSARVAQGAAVEAICRALLEGQEDAEHGEPPIPEPTAEVAEFASRWREFFDALRADAAAQPDAPAEP